MGKSNLLKEAIADAKAVRETALANARMRMEEAFTPRLQSMISAKLQNEIEGEDEDEEEIVDEPTDDEVPAEEPVEEPVEEPIEEPVEEPVGDELPAEEPIEPEGEEDFEAPVEEPVEIETEPEVDIEVEPSEDEIEDEGYELDLESIIKELEQESDIDDEMEEPMFEEKESEEEKEEEEEEAEELDESDNIETGLKTKKDVTPNLTASAPKAGGGEQTSPDRGKPFSSERGGEGKVSTDLKQMSKNAIYEEEEEEEEIDLNEILKELEEADVTASIPEELPDASNPFKSMNEQLKTKVSSLTKDLKEHRNVIKFLKSKLNEVNLLNAKLLFTSKLFKSNNMSNNEKMKVIESFDRAKTLREVKLVYSTIAESTNVKLFSNSKKVAKKITESIGGASKPVASTKQPIRPKKVIKEGIVSEEGAARLKKLAGIK